MGVRCAGVRVRDARAWVRDAGRGFRGGARRKCKDYAGGAVGWGSSVLGSASADSSGEAVVLSSVGAGSSAGTVDGMSSSFMGSAGVSSSG